MMDRAREQALIEQVNKEIDDYAKGRRKLVEQQIGRRVGYDQRTRKLRLSAFPGSSKIPLELLRAYLANRDRVDAMKVAERHAYLLPLALQAISAEGESIPARIWHDRLQSYQTGPMHALLRSAGYSPATVDNTLAKMRKLVRSGKPESLERRAYTVGTGERAITFAAGRQATYRGETRTVQVSGERYRVKINGTLVSLWTWFKDAVAKQDRSKVLAVMRQAEADAGARLVAKQLAEQRAARQAVELDSIELFAAETPGREADTAFRIDQ